MEQPLVSPAVPAHEKIDAIALVTLGMKVYDLAGKKVGHVDGMFGGAGSEPLPAVTSVAAVAAPGPMAGQQPAALVEPVIVPAGVPEFDDGLNSEVSMPRELRERLEHDGFIRIDAGFLKHHRFALRGQIAQVAGGVVTLNVMADELIKH